MKKEMTPEQIRDWSIRECSKLFSKLLGEEPKIETKGNAEIRYWESWKVGLKTEPYEKSGVVWCVEMVKLSTTKQIVFPKIYEILVEIATTVISGGKQ